MTIEKRQEDAESYANAVRALQEARSVKDSADRRYEDAIKCERTYISALVGTVGPNMRTRVFNVGNDSVVIVLYRNETVTSVTLHGMEPNV